MTNNNRALSSAGEVREMSDNEWDLFLEEYEQWENERMEKIIQERAAIDRARELREKKWATYKASDEYKAHMKLWQENRV